MSSYKTSPLCRQEQQENEQEEEASVILNSNTMHACILRLSLSISYHQFVGKIRAQWDIRVD